MGLLQAVIALFGTVGNSEWRERIAIPILQAAGVNYFNPKLGPGEWNESAIRQETIHKVYDLVLMHIITGETTSFGSLLEVGSSIARSIITGQQVIVFLEDVPTEEAPRKDERGGSLDPNGARSLLRLDLESLPKEAKRNLYVVGSIEEAAHKAVEMINAATEIVNP